jgi:hypothetical protein
MKGSEIREHIKRPREFFNNEVIVRTEIRKKREDKRVQ